MFSRLLLLSIFLHIFLFKRLDKELEYVPRESYFPPESFKVGILSIFTASKQSPLALNKILGVIYLLFLILAVIMFAISWILQI
jgi:hypothetical protein